MPNFNSLPIELVYKIIREASEEIEWSRCQTLSKFSLISKFFTVPSQNEMLRRLYSESFSKGLLGMIRAGRLEGKVVDYLSINLQDIEGKDSDEKCRNVYDLLDRCGDIRDLDLWSHGSLLLSNVMLPTTIFARHGLRNLQTLRVRLVRFTCKGGKLPPTFRHLYWNNFGSSESDGLFCLLHRSSSNLYSLHLPKIEEGNLQLELREFLEDRSRSIKELTLGYSLPTILPFFSSLKSLTINSLPLCDVVPILPLRSPNEDIQDAINILSCLPTEVRLEKLSLPNLQFPAPLSTIPPNYLMPIFNLPQTSELKVFRSNVSRGLGPVFHYGLNEVLSSVDLWYLKRMEKECFDKGVRLSLLSEQEEEKLEKEKIRKLYDRRQAKLDS